MKAFMDKHAHKIDGALSCIDRMLFRGYPSIMSGGAMALYLNQEHIKFRDLKTFLTTHALGLKHHAEAMAERLERPFSYLPSLVHERNNKSAQ